MVQGSGFRVQGSGFRVQGAGFMVQGSGFRMQGSGCRVIAYAALPCHQRCHQRGLDCLILALTVLYVPRRIALPSEVPSEDAASPCHHSFRILEMRVQG